ncbi:hypothetical protein Hanom_Chr12g01113571 [Helianthus anomalus]
MWQQFSSAFTQIFVAYQLNVIRLKLNMNVTDEEKRRCEISVRPINGESLKFCGSKCKTQTS